MRKELSLWKHREEGDTITTSTQAGDPRPVVLYLDDEKWLLPIAERLLTESGYEVVGLVDPQAALALLVANPRCVDLVVTDLHMSGMSGLELARELKKIRAELPVVLISGDLHESHMTEAAALGIAAVIYKPAISTELVKVVRGLLGARPSHPPRSKKAPKKSP